MMWDGRTLGWLMAVAWLTLAGGGLACRGNRAGEFEEIKPIQLDLDSRSIAMLDLRFPEASVTLVRAEAGDPLRVEGALRILSSDEATARLRASQLEPDLKLGAYTLLSLPPAQDDFAYEASFTIALPPGINLRLTMGAGNVFWELPLPQKTSVEVGRGVVVFSLPGETAAEVIAETNMGNVTVEGFAQIQGEVRRELVYAEYDSTLGDADQARGRQLEIRVNTGRISLTGDAERTLPEDEPLAPEDSPAEAPVP